MSRGKELLKNTAVVAIGKVCTKFLSFFLLPLYTAVLSTEDYGIVDLLGTYTLLLLPLIVFQIEEALFRFTIDVREKEEEKRKIVSTVIVFCAVQATIFLCIFLIVQTFIPSTYKWFLMTNVLLNIFSGPLVQLTRGLGDNYTYAFVSFLNAFVTIVLNIVLILGVGMGAEGLFIAAYTASAVVICYVVWKKKVYKMLRIRWFDRKCLKEMLAYSLPLVPNTLSWWVIGASDKSVVNFFLGVSQNGILSVSQKFSTLFTTFYSIFNLAWVENASVHKDDMDYETYYSQIIETTFRVLSCACLGIIAVVAIVFPWLINEKFGESYYQIPIYMLSSLLHSSIGIFSAVYIAYKRTAEVAKTSVLAAFINLTVNVLLIKHIGLYAASISSVIAYGTLLVIRYFDIQKFVKIRMKKSVMLSVVFVMIIDFSTYYIRNAWVSVLNLVLVAVYAVFMNRKIVIELLNIVKKKMKRGTV